MFSYGNTQSPMRSSPQASIIVCHPLGDSHLNVEAIVDSGAFMTCVPDTIISYLGTNMYGSITVSGPLNQPVTRKTYYIHMSIINNDDYTSACDCGLVEVIAIPRNYALIGRDVLNQYKVVLNAPHRIWGICCREHSCPISSDEF